MRYEATSTETALAANGRIINAATPWHIIVDTDDAVLVCSKNSTQDVKKVIAQLKEQGRNELV